jgi:hypothetical protein
MAEQPPQMPRQTYDGQPPRPSTGMAVAAMVLGIVALALFCLWYVSIPCGIVAIVLGVVARRRVAEGTGGGRGMATAGLICGVISIVLALLILALIAAGVTWLSRHPEFKQQIEQEMEKQQQRQGLPTPPGRSGVDRPSSGEPTALRPDPADRCTWRA